MFTALFNGTELRKGKFEAGDTGQGLGQHIPHEQCLGKTMFPFVARGSAKSWKVQVEGLQMGNLSAKSLYFIWVVGRFRVAIAAPESISWRRYEQFGQTRSADWRGSRLP